MNFKTTILTLFVALSFTLFAQNDASVSRQITTEPAATPAEAMQLAMRQIPGTIAIERVESTTLPEGDRYQRHNLALSGFPVYGKQIIIAPVGRGLYAASYPRFLPNEVKLDIEETIWQNKLEAILNEEAFEYENHHYGIVPTGLDFDKSTFALAAIIELFMPHSHRHDRLYLHAATGALIARHPIDCTFVPGTAQTLNYGEQIIETTQDGPNGEFRLFDETRGQGIQTVGADGQDIYDDDNDWAFEADSLSMALDVHHGMGETHDFFVDRFGRNGLDGNGVALRASTGIPFANAFYGGPQDIGIGAGDPNFFLDRPLSGIDVVAHEMAHGYTAFSSNLIYADESGGLNEAFSDISGVTVEHNTYNTSGPLAWTLGEEASSEGIYIRNMADPNELQMPDTYGGNFWNPGLPVHTGSSIANFWYYLIVMGDTGTNDIGYVYDVPGLGYDIAIQIVYDAWNNRLSASSNYADCSIATIAAATELYGACSPEVLAVEEAWRAVNVTAGVLGVGQSDVTRVCDLEQGVTFTASVPGTFVEWQFGDGESSTDNPATHIYTEDGSYTATYRFINCAGDTLSGSASNAVLISTEDPEACNFVPFDQSTQTLNNCSGVLVDDGGEEGNYSDGVNADVILFQEGVTGFRLTFDFFELESGYDFFRVFDENEELIGTYTGNFVPNELEVFGEQLRLNFFTDGTVTAPGFVISYTCFAPTSKPTAGIAATDYEDCRANRTYTSDSEEYPDQFTWYIDGEVVGDQEELNINWADYGPGTYSLTLEVCNNIGCDDITIDEIVITEEVGTCEEFLAENGTIDLTGCIGGTIHDDGGPDENYSNSISSTINISNEEGRNIQLDFQQLWTESSYDFLFIYDLNAPGDPIAAYDGLYDPFMIEFETDALSIVFQTDFTVVAPGFTILYGCAEPSSIRDNLLDIDWQVSPNPFDQTLNVSGLPSAEWTFELQAIDGRILQSWTEMRTSAGGQLTLQASGLPAGTYILQARDQDGGLLIKRLVKQ
ncbi:MAG: M4 family metallopeptidase [Bacteroidota bacterium]